MQILTVANQKGGTGKTATAAAIAQAAASKRRHVLAIDLDPQGNLSYSLGANTGNTDNSGSYDLITGEDAARLIQKTPQGISVIPASWNLQTVKTTPGSARRLAKALEPLTGRYDLIIIDTPPTGGELQYNALQAATGLIIPLQADIFGLQGLYQIADTASQFQQTNPALAIKGVVFTRHNARSTLTRQMADTITKTAAGMNIRILGSVRESVALREAVATQQSLYEYAPRSNPAADYMAIYTKLMKG